MAITDSNDVSDIIPMETHGRVRVLDRTDLKQLAYTEADSLKQFRCAKCKRFSPKAGSTARSSAESAGG